MRFQTSLSIVIVVIAIITVIAPGFVLGQSALNANQTQQSASAANTTTITIYPHPDGDARFQVSITFILNEENESAAFRALAREFESGETGFSVSTFRRAANQSSIVTGRQMNITNVTRNATIIGENTSRTDIGKLVLRFTWTNFAQTNGSSVAIGDVFHTTYGTWLPGLTANQTLIIKSPPQYFIAGSPVGFRNGTIQFDGPRMFDPGSPAITFQSRTDNRSTQKTDNGWEERPSLVSPYILGVGILILGIGIAALGVYALTLYNGTNEYTIESEWVKALVLDESSENTPSTDSFDDPTEEALITDEEHIEQLLVQNNGRMKQATIVSETGWSNAKVSQLLSAMDKKDRIDKLRIGRENLISLSSDEK
ncbi:MAG TPA: hypothetical protein VFJ06_04195 [Halococcus sp.]|nr:hypothetical protein [Halococcus sp.]